MDRGVDAVGRWAHVCGALLLVGVVALLFSQAWSAAVVVAVLAGVNFGVGRWMRRRARR